MKEFINSLEGLPLLVKLILALPTLDIVWGIYRILSALDAKNTVALVVSIILLFVPFMWIIDIVMILLQGRVWKLA
ncbi:MAG: hypothetical protein K6A33_11080 [Clostridiales bacterium]|nr:hypothetical protein [Clostridiales bacterium]